MLSPSTNYRTPEELAADPAFIRWVQDPTPATDAHWQRWLEADALRLVLEQQARQLVGLLQFQSVSLDLANRRGLEAKLRQKMVEIALPTVGSALEAPVLPLRPRTAPGWMAYIAAASVMAVLLTGFWFWQHRTIAPDRTYTTAYGQTQRIELPDQSIVTLNANSRLRLVENWTNNATREVWLDGEAFFDIRKKPGTKAAQFTVHSGRVHVGVLGTTFNVTQRRGTTQVVLSTGSVRLEGLPTGTQFMTPGDRVVYRETAGLPDDRRVERSRVNPANYMAWQQREWVLDNTSLEEIATMLNDQFGLMVLVNPPLSERRLSGRMSIESPDVFLENLSTILGVSIRRTATNQILIQPQ
ncbi:MAG: FecR domain-containing protein [Bacteroidetes bacterium]|nr:FecR domain-containing protein [Fibrella sp.]